MVLLVLFFGVLYFSRVNDIVGVIFLLDGISVIEIENLVG